MNDRLQKLATEVGISVEYLTNTKQLVLIEKFAELLLRDCVHNLFYEGHEDAAIKLKALISTRFGVK